MTTIGPDPATVDITVNQDAYTAPSALFSPDNVSGDNGATVGSSVVSYIAGSWGDGWTISKQSGDATAAFTPSTGTTSPSLSIDLTGSLGQSAIYQIINDNSGIIMDTIDIDITSTLSTGFFLPPSHSGQQDSGPYGLDMTYTPGSDSTGWRIDKSLVGDTGANALIGSTGGVNLDSESGTSSKSWVSGTGLFLTGSNGFTVTYDLIETFDNSLLAQYTVTITP